MPRKGTHLHPSVLAEGQTTCHKSRLPGDAPVFPRPHSHAKIAGRRPETLSPLANLFYFIYFFDVDTSSPPSPPPFKGRRPTTADNFSGENVRKEDGEQRFLPPPQTDLLLDEVKKKSEVAAL
ncbi:hypothetical protein JTE90_011503 [Oedothorax gibbosus]|uniref:Uncharacterized protein n=1 Tax=Oedothorax gibbosus TaxID=931172 RepID=A0AAV6VE74_9ARAC|nr:hypothetical protein JTE90_011503 [Oedothorax gibbosus]